MKKIYKRAGLFDSNYSLFLYLLVSTKEEIDSTFFFFSDGIPEQVREYFSGQSYYIKREKDTLINEIKQIFRGWTRYIKWPFLKHCDFFGMPFCFVEILGNDDIIQIEEGFEHIGISSILNNRRKFHKLRNILHGAMYDNYSFTSPQIKSFVLTRPLPETIFAPQRIIDLQQEWNKSQETQQLILEAHRIDLTMVEKLKNCKCMLLMQTFAEDNLISLEEEIGLYKEITSKYNPSDILIKPHPRSYLRKEEYFPESLFWNITCPVQLLALCGFAPQTIETINSTAANNAPFKNAVVNMRGTKGVPGLISKFGETDAKSISL